MPIYDTRANELINKQLFGLLFSFAFLLQGGGQPITIPVSTNWTLGAGTASFKLADGTTVIDAGYGSSFWQTLTMTPAQLQMVQGGALDGIYLLTFEVVNGIPSGKYPGYYKVEINFGSQELCEADGWGTMFFEQVPVVCLGPQYIVGAHARPSGGLPQGNNPFVIHFTVNDGSANGGWQLFFKDNVSLTFTPTN